MITGSQPGTTALPTSSRQSGVAPPAIRRKLTLEINGPYGQAELMFDWTATPTSQTLRPRNHEPSGSQVTLRRHPSCGFGRAWIAGEIGRQPRQVVMRQVSGGWQYRAMTLVDLARLLQATRRSDWWRLVAEFLEEYRWEPVDHRHRLLATEPPGTGDEKWDVLLAAPAEHLAARDGRGAPAVEASSFRPTNWRWRDRGRAATGGCARGASPRSRHTAIVIAWLSVRRMVANAPSAGSCWAADQWVAPQSHPEEWT